MTTLSPWLAVLLAALAGVGIAFQSATNAVLGRALGHPSWASFWQFAAGTVLIIVVMLAMRVPAPTLANAAAAPWWIWIGFITGSYFVAAAVGLSPVIGVGGFIAALVAGQMITSIILDHYGLVGLTERPITWARIAGAGLIIVGVLLIMAPTQPK